jgi:hypothetical protein
MRSACEWATGARAGAAAAALAVALPGASARAAEGADVTYGRAEGDLTLVAGVGATIADRGLRGEGELRLRYLETAGLFASYEDGPLFGSQAEPQRVFATGLEVRPLFLFRWLDGHETSRAPLDLVIDSLGLEFGAAFQQPYGESFDSRPAVQAGLMVELPIVAKATGPWLALHGGLRWSDSSLAEGSSTTPDDRSFYLTVTAAWHQVVLSHTVDVRDRPAE